MISIGCIVYLNIGGVIGAFLFSVGLLAVLTLNYELFTGKAGLYATGDIKPNRLAEIWLGNLFGAIMSGAVIIGTPIGMKVSEEAMKIVETRIGNGFMVNLIYGIFCGILMFVAVKGFNDGGRLPILAIMPVMVFIMCGFNHCVADMFYTVMGCCNLSEVFPLIPTTVGNFIGCNLAPYLIEWDKWDRNYYC